jgi:hypothetical protein
VVLEDVGLALEVQLVLDDVALVEEDEDALEHDP